MEKKELQRYKERYLGVGEEMNRQSIEDFQGSENTLHDTIVMDMSLYIFPNLQNVKYQE